MKKVSVLAKLSSCALLVFLGLAGPAEAQTAESADAEGKGIVESAGEATAEVANAVKAGRKCIVENFDCRVVARRFIDIVTRELELL